MPDKFVCVRLNIATSSHPGLVRRALPETWNPQRMQRRRLEGVLLFRAFIGSAREFLELAVDHIDVSKVRTFSATGRSQWRWISPLTESNPPWPKTYSREGADQEALLNRLGRPSSFPLPEVKWPIRILLASSSHQPNGIERFTDLLHEALLLRGHEVALFSAKAARSPTRRKVKAGLRRAVGPLATATSWPAVRSAARSHRADVVHYTYPEYLGPMTGVASVASVWHSHVSPVHRAQTSAVRGERKKDGLLYGLSDQIAFRLADRLVAHSQIASESASTVNPRVDWIPPFIPDGMVTSGASRRDPVAVVVATRLGDPRKNVRLAIDAVSTAAIPSLELLLVGDVENLGPLPSNCRSVGRRTTSEVQALLARAQVMLVPSLYEEFGYVGLEGLANGCPVIMGPLDGYLGLSAPGLYIVDRSVDSFAQAIHLAVVGDLAGLPEECTEAVAVARLMQSYEAARSE